jgi:hypothetical protein
MVQFRQAGLGREVRVYARYRPTLQRARMAQGTEKRKIADGDTPDAADQGGEGNEGEGPAQGEQASGDAPALQRSDSATDDDSDREAVERGDADDVGSRAEEVQRAERREREAAEG